jgi:2-phosphosulfolactate phosphatase
MDLSKTTCIVIDILRATSTIVTALANKVSGVIPVSTVAEALAMKARYPNAMLAGERNSYRIGKDLTGGIEFDFGNSPREFLDEKGRDRLLILTTTNGTRAFDACRQAKSVVAMSFLNLSVILRYLMSLTDNDFLIICGGTHDEVAMEDVLAAGAIIDGLEGSDRYETNDSAIISLELYRLKRQGLRIAIAQSQNGKRLLSISELAADIEFCSRQDVYSVLPMMRDGIIAAF